MVPISLLRQALFLRLYGQALRRNCGAASCVISKRANDASRKADYSFPIALVVGHESVGVSKEVLKICDQVVEIPMWGVNKSLNVVVSLGIVLFKVMEKLPL